MAAVAASVKLIAIVPMQLSVAVAVPVFAGAVEAPHCNSLSGGQVIVGGVVSTKRVPVPVTPPIGGLAVTVKVVEPPTIIPAAVVIVRVLFVEVSAGLKITGLGENKPIAPVGSPDTVSAAVNIPLPDRVKVTV